MERQEASSKVVRVLSGANGGNVVAAIGVTIRQAKVSPAPNCPGAGGIYSELGTAVNLFASPSLPPSASSSIYKATFVFFIACTHCPVDGL
ncbi:hypothetical protein M405DRAFT_833622 [Rhizopogon salebrosus TDB-379]|nr:hypothetical protein M405DRAFT_833622 [Rhizopogon salebrosus TDB-379]